MIVVPGGPPLPVRFDLRGQRSGRLVAVSVVDKDRHGKTRWLCQCDCGGTTTIPTSVFRRGDQGSCGCSPRHVLGAHRADAGPAMVPGCARVWLTGGEYAIVDAEDEAAAARNHWHAHAGRHGTFYARRTRRTGDVADAPHYLHQLILGCAWVDHINGDGLDNRRTNLRPCTRAQNMHNQRKRRGVSQFKGVYWHTSGRKWKAQITESGHRRSLGYHPSEESAARAYDAAARRLFGEYAALNFPLPGEQFALTESALFQEIAA